MGGFLDGSWNEEPAGRFSNRHEAGVLIAAKFGEEFLAYEGKGVIIGLPRGGVEVAAAVAKDLGLPLDFRAVKKVGHPMQPEFAIGAVDISGTSVRNPYLGPSEMPSDDDFNLMVKKAVKQARAFEAELRAGGISYARTADWCVLVDDGAATGLTVLTAVRGLLEEGKKVHVAVPVASRQAEKLITQIATSFHALMIPAEFIAVGQFYANFAPVPMNDVSKFLR